jgi:hypothetical protein
MVFSGVALALVNCKTFWHRPWPDRMRQEPNINSVSFMVFILSLFCGTAYAPCQFVLMYIVVSKNVQIVFTRPKGIPRHDEHPDKGII